MHALAYGFTPLAVERGATAKKLISILKKTQLYTDAATFKSKLPSTPIKPSKESTFTFIDLFAGVGGMRIGFQKAGGTCMFLSEFEKNAQATYAENHGDYPFGSYLQCYEARPDPWLFFRGIFVVCMMACCIKESTIGFQFP